MPRHIENYHVWCGVRAKGTTTEGYSVELDNPGSKIVSQRVEKKEWVAPELVQIGDVSDVAGGPAPTSQTTGSGGTQFGKLS